MRINIVAERVEGTFCVSCAELPEVVAEGNTLFEAVQSWNGELMDWAISKAVEGLASQKGE